MLLHFELLTWQGFVAITSAPENILLLEKHCSNCLEIKLYNAPFFVLTKCEVGHSQSPKTGNWESNSCGASNFLVHCYTSKQSGQRSDCKRSRMEYTPKTNPVKIGYENRTKQNKPKEFKGTTQRLSADKAHSSQAFTHIVVFTRPSFNSII